MHNFNLKPQWPLLSKFKEMSQIAHLYKDESSLALTQPNCDEQFRHLKLTKLSVFSIGRVSDIHLSIREIKNMLHNQHDE